MSLNQTESSPKQCVITMHWNADASMRLMSSHVITKQSGVWLRPLAVLRPSHFMHLLFCGFKMSYSDDEQLFVGFLA